MKPLKTKVSITLDSTIIDILKDLAERDDRSFSQYVNLVLKAYLTDKGYFDRNETEKQVD